MKHSVQSVIEEKSQKKDDLNAAVLRLAKASETDEAVDREALAFKAKQWEEKKVYLETKLSAKYSYKKEQNDAEKERLVLQILKEDRDHAISLYKDEADTVLKEFFLEDVKTARELYRNKIKEFTK